MGSPAPALLVVGENLSPLVKTLKCFEKVVHGCFGKVASENYQSLIDDFENAWLENYSEFDTNFTKKAHILISHVPQVIQRTGKGLFCQSEEVVEAAHAKFDKFWQRYKVIEVESDKHGENLLQCVIDFVTKNI